MDPYKILGVSRNATQDEIKKAYRRLALETHPDRNKGDENAEERFKNIGRAWDILSDPKKKAEYDNPGAPFGFSFSFGFDPFQRPPPPPVPRRGTIRGRPFQAKLDVNVFDILMQAPIQLRYKKMVPCVSCEGHGADLKHCPDCGGYGVARDVQDKGHQKIVREYPCETCGQRGFVQDFACDDCKGTGLTASDVEFTFTLTNGNPEHVISGEGNYGPYGGPPGDLILHVNVVYPEPGKVTDEVKEHLRSAIDLIYHKE